MGLTWWIRADLTCSNSSRGGGGCVRGSGLMGFTRWVRADLSRANGGRGGGGCVGGSGLVGLTGWIGAYQGDSARTFSSCSSLSGTWLFRGWRGQDGHRQILHWLSFYSTWSCYQSDLCGLVLGTREQLLSFFDWAKLQKSKAFFIGCLSDQCCQDLPVL